MANFMDRFIRQDYFKSSDRSSDRNWDRGADRQRRRPEHFGDEYSDRRRASNAERESSFEQFEDSFGFSDNRAGRTNDRYAAESERENDTWGQSRPRSQTRTQARTHSQRPGDIPSRRRPEPAASRERSFSDDFDSFDSFDRAENSPASQRDPYYFDNFEGSYDIPDREADAARDLSEDDVIPAPRKAADKAAHRVEESQDIQPALAAVDPKQQYHLATVLEEVARYLEELQEENSEAKEENKKNQRMIAQINKLINETVINVQGMRKGFQEYLRSARNDENHQAVLAQTQMLDEKVENLTALLQGIIQERQEHPDITTHLEEQNRILEEMSAQVKESQEVVQNLEGRFDLLKESLISEQKELLNEKEKLRRKDFAITRTYFRTIMWLLLIIIVMLGAWLLGLIGPVGSTTNPMMILLGLLTL